MTAWDELVSVALVGTERKPVPATVTTDVAVALGAELPAAAPELAVLTAAGVLASYRRAGWAPPRDGVVPEPAPEDDRPLASTTAVQLLELLLGGQVSVYGGVGFLVAEWLERCAASGRRPPERLLPQLLTGASGDRSLRAPTVAAGGARLRWLAARNPDWAWAAAAPTEVTDPAEAWTTGSKDVRLGFLAELRATDPEAARTLVESTWTGEAAKDRATILATFATGLADADEPFLEAALDDRSAPVRTTAAALLTRLPNSHLACRMTDRLAPLVGIGGRLRKKLEVTLPDELDPAARRDGIVDTGAPPKVGPKAWWLTQIVAATPLLFWERHLGLDAAAVARLVDTPEVAKGLAAAAARQRDRVWANALLVHHPDPGLLAVVAPEDVDVHVAVVLGAATDPLVPATLAAIPAPWSPFTSRAAVERLKAGKTSGPLQSSASTLARSLHPGTDLEAWVASLKDNEHARRQVRGLAHALSIRQTIAQELT